MSKTLKELFPRQPKLYSCSAVESLINQYFEAGGEVFTVEEGCLGYGLMVLTGDELKTAIIKEVYLNEWSSAHTIRFYNEIPRKYAVMIEAI